MVATRIWRLACALALAAVAQVGCGGTPSVEETFVAQHPCGSDQVRTTRVNAKASGTWNRVEGCGTSALVRVEVAKEHETCRVFEHEVLGQPSGARDSSDEPTALIPCPSGTVCRRYDPPCCGGTAAAASWTCVAPDRAREPVLEP